MNHNRLDQLADGIFAIVMTILVFDIRVPVILGPVNNTILWFQIKYSAFAHLDRLDGRCYYAHGQR